MTTPPRTSARAPNTTQRQLTASIDRLRRVVERMSADYAYVLHPSKSLFLSYLRGIVAGLGALTAVAIVIPLIVWVLRGIQWVPIVGDFVANIAHRVEQAQGR